MGALRVFDRHLRVFFRTWRSNLAFNVIEPLLYLAALGFGLGAFVQEIEGMSYIQFIAPGMIALSAMYSAVFECTYGTFVRLTIQKTLHAMLAAPVTVRDVVLGEILYAVFKSTLFGIVILGVVTALGQIRSPWALLVPLFLVANGFVFAVMAMWYTSASSNFDHLNYFITLVILPFFLFGGLYFPVSALPTWVQLANWLNPLYHTVEICRSLAVGQAIPSIWPHFLALVVMGTAMLPFPLKAMEKKLLS